MPIRDKIELAKYNRDYYQTNRKKMLAKQKIKNVAAAARKRLWLWDLKSSKGCSRCPETHPACSQFHHRDPKKKEFTVSQKLMWSKERILKEIEKCDVLCGNCHTKEHWPDICRRELALSQKGKPGVEKICT